MVGLVNLKELLQKAGLEVNARSNAEQRELDTMRRVLGLLLLQTPKKAERERMLVEWQDLPKCIFQELEQIHQDLCKVFPF